VNRTTRAGIVTALGVALALAAAIGDVGSNAPDLVILGTALVVGELFELRPAGRAPLPLSFAVVVVLVRAADTEQYAAIIVLGFLVGVALRDEPGGLLPRVALYGERVLEGLAAGAVYHAIIDSSARADSRAIVLGALAATVIVEIVLSDLANLLRGRRIAPLRARGADLALVTSGMLMAVGYGGIGGEGQLGLWGPLLFSIPLLAAWYSFELLASTRRSFRQTVRALGAAPELGGLVREGHVERVAALAVEMGNDLGLPDSDVEDLETAALLHHLGAVCLDESEGSGQLDPVAVAEAGASMLRGSEALAPAGDIVAAEPSLHRAPGVPTSPRSALAGQVLKVASAYDELTEGSPEHAAWALEALYTGPLYVYDGRVVGALERVLERRGVLVARD
jgi:HD domain